MNLYIAGELREARVEKGKHTTGCIKVDEKYLHAARDAGLGSDQGIQLLQLQAPLVNHLNFKAGPADPNTVLLCVRNNPGMYSHLSVLRKAGVDVLRPSDIDNAGPGDMGGGYAYVRPP